MISRILKDVVTPTVSLYIGYSGSDYLPRKTADTMPPVPAAFLSGAPHAAGRFSLETPSNASAQWLPAISSLYDRIVDPERTIRRVNITCCDIAHEEFRQMGLFDTPADTEKNRRMQSAILEIQTLNLFMLFS